MTLAAGPFRTMLLISRKADLCGELLTLLSTQPAPIQCIADDLRIQPSGVWSLIKRLQVRGYAIETARDGAEAVVFANPSGWEGLKRKAESYFERMYG